MSFCELVIFSLLIFARILLGENKIVQESVIRMWRFVQANIEEHDMYTATDPVCSYIYNLARLTGNLAVKCESNQTWIARCVK